MSAVISDCHLRSTARRSSVTPKVRNEHTGLAGDGDNGGTGPSNEEFSADQGGGQKVDIHQKETQQGTGIMTPPPSVRASHQPVPLGSSPLLKNGTWPADVTHPSSAPSQTCELAKVAEVSIVAGHASNASESERVVYHITSLQKSLDADNRSSQELREHLASLKKQEQQIDVKTEALSEEAATRERDAARAKDVHDELVQCIDGLRTARAGRATTLPSNEGPGTAADLIAQAEKMMREAAVNAKRSAEFYRSSMLSLASHMEEVQAVLVQLADVKQKLEDIGARWSLETKAIDQFMELHDGVVVLRRKILEVF